jgi:hypothetical protein
MLGRYGLGTVHALTSTVMVLTRILIPLTLLVVALAACNSGDSSKPELKVCTAGQNGCPSESALTSKPKGGSGADGPTDQAPAAPPPSGPASAPQEKGSSSETAKSDPTGTPVSETTTDPGSPDILTSCGLLKGCCDNLTAAGQDATSCNQTRNAGVESDCDTAFDQYAADPMAAGCGLQD